MDTFAGRRPPDQERPQSDHELWSLRVNMYWATREEVHNAFKDTNLRLVSATQQKYWEFTRDYMKEHILDYRGKEHPTRECLTAAAKAYRAKLVEEAKTILSRSE